MKTTTKTVLEIVKDAGADPDMLTMDKTGRVPVYVETAKGNIRLVTGAYVNADGALTLRTSK